MNRNEAFHVHQELHNLSSMFHFEWEKACRSHDGRERFYSDMSDAIGGIANKVFDEFDLGNPRKGEGYIMNHWTLVFVPRETIAEGSSSLVIRSITMVIETVLDIDRAETFGDEFGNNAFPGLRLDSIY